MWMDANAPYHDTFVNKRPEKPAYDLAQDDELLDKLRGMHEQRCAGCHATEIVSRLDWIDIHQADGSLFLRAPLAKSSGGTQKCGQASMPATRTRTTWPCGRWSKMRWLEPGPTRDATCRH